MIDTIVLRLHDLSLFERHIEILDGLTSTNGFTRMRVEDDSEINVSQRRTYSDYLKFHDSLKEKTLFRKGELNSSYHYLIKYFVDYDRKFIQLEFSVPKYLYGTNVILFCKYYTAKDFSYAYHKELKNNLYESRKNLLFFIKSYFTRIFGELKIPLQALELNRVDLCYNQVFPSKDVALSYLAEIRKVKKRFARDTSNVSNYLTSYNYVSNLYSFKIYHKGTEFKKHDKKRLYESKANVDLNYLTDLADRTLRYEITFRSAYLSYVFDTDILRADCAIFQESRKVFNAVDNAAKKGTVLKLDRYERGLLAMYKKLVGNRKSCMFRVLDKERAAAELTNPSDYREPDKLKRMYHFEYSQDFHKAICDRFLEHINEFKLSQKLDLQTILSRVQRNNEAKKLQDSLGVDLGNKAMYLSKFRMIIELMEANNYTFQDLKTFGVLPERTFYLWKKKLKSVGVDPDGDFLPISVSNRFDLSDYYAEILTNSQKLKNLNFLDFA